MKRSPQKRPLQRRGKVPPTEMLRGGPGGLSQAPWRRRPHCTGPCLILGLRGGQRGCAGGAEAAALTEVSCAPSLPRSLRPRGQEKQLRAGSPHLASECYLLLGLTPSLFPLSFPPSFLFLLCVKEPSRASPSVLPSCSVPSVSPTAGSLPLNAASLQSSDGSARAGGLCAPFVQAAGQTPAGITTRAVGTPEGAT